MLRIRKTTAIACKNDLSPPFFNAATQDWANAET
jgi:hypothetical protein